MRRQGFAKKPRINVPATLGWAVLPRSPNIRAARQLGATDDGVIERGAPTGRRAARIVYA
jgi:hypothetical protein